MGRRKHYPDTIDRKYETAPTRRDTDESLEGAEIVAEEWNADATFSSIEELDSHDLSRSTIQRAWSHYFGPEDDERSFYEIEQEYGSTDEYYELKEEGRLDEVDEEDFAKGPVPEVAIEAFQQGYEQGRLDERREQEAREQQAE